MSKSSKSPRKTLHPFALDARAQGTLRRFVADWILPRWRKILVALLFTAGLAATTGGYPLIIKHSFDSLMKAESGVLPWVIAAIIGVTSMRSLFLYLQQVTAARIVTRMATDIQKAAFAHLINSDYARLTRETTGHLVSRLTNDLAVIQQAAQVSMIAFVRDVLSVIVGVRRHALPRLDDDADRDRHLSPGGAAGRAASASGCARWRAAPRPSSAT